MTSQEIFKIVNPQAMLQQQQQQKLQEAQTGISKQNIVSTAIMASKGVAQAPQGQMPGGSNPQGWGRTA